jgi:hypothetical protein
MDNFGFRDGLKLEIYFKESEVYKVYGILLIEIAPIILAGFFSIQKRFTDPQVGIANFHRQVCSQIVH